MDPADLNWDCCIFWLILHSSPTLESIWSLIRCGGVLCLPLFRRSQTFRNAILLVRVLICTAYEGKSCFSSNLNNMIWNISVSPQIGLIKDALKVLPTLSEPSFSRESSWLVYPNSGVLLLDLIKTLKTCSLESTFSLQIHLLFQSWWSPVSSCYLSFSKDHG